MFRTTERILALLLLEFKDLPRGKQRIYTCLASLIYRSWAILLPRLEQPKGVLATVGHVEEPILILVLLVNCGHQSSCKSNKVMKWDNMNHAGSLRYWDHKPCSSILFDQSPCVFKGKWFKGFSDLLVEEYSSQRWRLLSQDWAWSASEQHRQTAQR